MEGLFVFGQSRSQVETSRRGMHDTSLPSHRSLYGRVSFRVHLTYQKGSLCPEIGAGKERMAVPREEPIRESRRKTG
jgi:hypothetical protein